MKYPVGSKHTAKVRNFTNFGIFVELEEGVDGLIHISDLSWTKKIKHPSEFTKVGETIDVVVLEIDKENRRLSLGHKQLEQNPWDTYETIYKPGTVHIGKITESMDKGCRHHPQRGWRRFRYAEAPRQGGWHAGSARRGAAVHGHRVCQGL